MYFALVFAGSDGMYAVSGRRVLVTKTVCTRRDNRGGRGGRACPRASCDSDRIHNVDTFAIILNKKEHNLYAPPESARRHDATDTTSARARCGSGGPPGRTRPRLAPGRARAA